MINNLIKNAYYRKSKIKFIYAAMHSIDTILIFDYIFTKVSYATYREESHSHNFRILISSAMREHSRILGSRSIAFDK